MDSVYVIYHSFFRERNNKLFNQVHRIRLKNNIKQSPFKYNQIGQLSAKVKSIIFKCKQN